MKNLIYKEFKNKNILILGFGKEGKSTYLFIRKKFKDIQLGIADMNQTVVDEEVIKNDKYITFHLGEDYLNCTKQYDLIIKSPGIVLQNFEASKMTSQTDLFLKYYSKNVVGVTATKGKTTTVTLINFILENAGRDVMLVGNIGFPVFDKIDEINEDTIVVYELSSYQLEHVHNSPHIAIILNMFQDHLSTHGTMENYKQAKFNIAKYQTEEDIFIYNLDNEITKSFGENIEAKGKRIIISQQSTDVDVYIKDDYIVYNDEKVYDLRQPKNLIGTHINYNIMSAIVVCKMLGVSSEVISNSINKYVPEPHRLEYVGNYSGIRFYNDSIATIPEPTMEGIKALKEVDTLIVGGYDKGVEFMEFADFLVNSNVKNILCMYETGKIVYNLMKDKIKYQNLMYVKGLQEAVRISKLVTEKGKICLMSPASASFGAFKNFEERGEIFRELVRKE